MMEGIQNCLKWINYLHSNIIFIFFFALGDYHKSLLVSSSQYFPSSSVFHLSLSCFMKIFFLNQLLFLVICYRHIPEDILVVLVGGKAVRFELSSTVTGYFLGSFKQVLSSHRNSFSLSIKWRHCDD